MGSKMAIAFANIFMAKIEQAILRQNKEKPLVWKRFIDDIFCLWDSNKEDIEIFIEKANAFHPTIKFTAEVSEIETTFLDTTVYKGETKGERFEKERILDVRTHFKPTETFQYTHFNSCHPAGVKKGFVKGEALRLLRTNSSKSTFEENIENFKTRLTLRGYSEQKVDNPLRRQDRSSQTKIEIEQKDSTLCHGIPTVIATLEKHTYGQMAFNTEPSVTQRDIQGASLDLLQKRKIAKRYAC